jgi:hypothetical protein
MQIMPGEKTGFEIRFMNSKFKNMFDIQKNNLKK